MSKIEITVFVTGCESSDHSIAINRGFDNIRQNLPNACTSLFFFKNEESQKNFMKMSVVCDGFDSKKLAALTMFNPQGKRRAQERVLRANAASDKKLTAREGEIALHLCSGLSRKKAAEKLGISEKTVHNHVSNIYLKTGIHNIAVLIRFAKEKGWFVYQE